MLSKHAEQSMRCIICLVVIMQRRLSVSSVLVCVVQKDDVKIGERAAGAPVRNLNRFADRYAPSMTKNSA